MTDFESIWSPAKVFSPTAAKQASLQQKDWAYVDAFLSSRFSPKPVPKFERNADTLKALLALAAANEAADEEKDLERRVKEKTLAELKKREQEAVSRSQSNAEPLLTAIEESLTDEGQRCLNSVALLGVALASNSTDPQRLSMHLIDLSKQEFAVQQQTLRIDALHQRLQADLAALREAMVHLNTDDAHKLPADLAAKVTEWARTSRHLRNKAEDYKERLDAKQGVKESLTVPALVKMETEVLALKEHVLDLEAQAKGYQGLPPEKDLARLEVERVQEELEGLEKKREGLYDGMVGGQ